jgi:hypothetical protein
MYSSEFSQEVEQFIDKAEKLETEEEAVELFDDIVGYRNKEGLSFLEEYKAFFPVFENVESREFRDKIMDRQYDSLPREDLGDFILRLRERPYKFVGEEVCEELGIPYESTGPEYSFKLGFYKWDDDIVYPLTSTKPKEDDDAYLWPCAVIDQNGNIEYKYITETVFDRDLKPVGLSADGKSSCSLLNEIDKDALPKGD